MPAGEQFKLRTALFDEELERLDNYPAFVRIIVRLS